MEYDEEELRNFISIQISIEKYNSEGIFNQAQQNEDNLESLLFAKKQAELDYRVKDEQLKKQKQDLENISSTAYLAYFQSKDDHQVIVNKENKEFNIIQKLVEQSSKELKSCTDKYLKAIADDKEFNKKHKKAIALFEEQVNLLNMQSESQLEGQIEEHRIEKDKIKSAINRWKNSRFLVIYAYKQLKCAEERWTNLMKIDVEDQAKVIPATEAINNLISAEDNIIKANKILQGVQFPFCTSDHLEIMHSITNNAYDDMKTKDSQNEDMKHIKILCKQCASLKQWMDHVIKESLVKQFSLVMKNYSQTTKELRNKRVIKIKDKISERFGKDMNFETLNNIACNKEEKILNEMESGNEKIEIDENELMNKFELPPPPSHEKIMGNLEEIKKEYRENTKGWNKHLDDSRKQADEKLLAALSKYNIAPTKD